MYKVINMKALAHTLFLACAMALACISCTKGDYSFDAPIRDSDSAIGLPSEGGGQGGQQDLAGKITAGEWNDLDNWSFWGDLMTPSQDQEKEGFYKYTADWGFNTSSRVAVKVSDGAGKPAAGVSVYLKNGNKVIWKSRTDNLGRADCWVGMFDRTNADGNLSIMLNDTAMSGSPQVSTFESGLLMNEYTLNAAKELPKQADILFIVDATGSMLDEIAFLKADLMNILNKVKSEHSSTDLRTGALFYRDKGDEYVTKVSQFSGNVNETVSFIGKQGANGGGDYPEAVHTALEHSIQKLSWRNEARTKLAFMLLDAPAHIDEQGVVASLHESIEYYAAQGIKLIPVASSGVDKSTEFMLRLFSITTNGTYVFLTNDSGIGGDHIEPTIGEYKVELLSDLMIRLIDKYLE